MSERAMKKYILLGICVFMVGFACLILYYVNYEKETQERDKNEYIEDIVLTDQEKIDEMVVENDIDNTKFGETEIHYDYSENDMDKFNKYVEEQLNLKTDKTEDETTKIYNETLKSVRLQMFAKQYDDAVTKIYEVMSETVFVDNEQFVTLVGIQHAGGFDKLSGPDKIFAIQGIKDPAIYVALFYALSPSYQASLLPNENFLFVPASEENQITYLGFEEAGALESRANEYFSELSETRIYKVKIDVLGIEYNIFVAGTLESMYQITNIEYADKTNHVYNNYTDYFNVWGRETVDYHYE